MVLTPTSCNRIISNVLSMELFRVMEYVRENGYHSQEVMQVCLEVYEFISYLDNLSNEWVEEN